MSCSFETLFGLQNDYWTESDFNDTPHLAGDLALVTAGVLLIAVVAAVEVSVANLV